MAFTFRNPAHQFHYERIQRLLEEILPGAYTVDEDASCFDLKQGSARASLWVFGEDLPLEATVSLRCRLVGKVRKRELPKLMRFLLEKNTSMNFGGLGMDDENNVLISHTFASPYCDKRELATVIVATLLAADELDDAIKAQFGGKTLGG